MAQITNFDRETFFIHALEFKLWLFEVCIGSHSLAVFANKILRAHEINFTGAQGDVDDPLPKVVNIAVWVPACIVWLYYAPSSAVWGF